MESLYKTFIICFSPSFLLMLIFVLVNLPYYKRVYGSKLVSNLIRTILLNTVAIIIGWFPVVYLWSKFSIQFLLPASCIFGAIAVVGSRFIYHEFVPENLVKELLIELKKESSENSAQ